MNLFGVMKAVEKSSAYSGKWGSFVFVESLLTHSIGCEIRQLTHAMMVKSM